MKKTLLILSFILVSIASFAQRQRATAMFDSDTTTRPKAGFYGIGVRGNKVYFVPPSGTTFRVLNANTHVGINGQFLFTNGSVNYFSNIAISNVTSLQSSLDAKFTLPSLTSGSVLFSNGTTISQNNSQFFWDNSNSRLGIGISTPTNSINIRKDASTTVSSSSITSNTVPAIVFSNFDLTANAGASISFQLGGSGTAWASMAALRTSSNNSELVFYTEKDDVFSEKLRINSSGNVGIGTTPDASAKLHVSSTTQGVLITRGTTTQINAIASPANGLMVYNTTLNKLCVYENGTWKQVTTTNM